jgi:hypothetical protein
MIGEVIWIEILTKQTEITIIITTENEANGMMKKFMI